MRLGIRSSSTLKRREHGAQRGTLSLWRDDLRDRRGICPRRRADRVGEMHAAERLGRGDQLIAMMKVERQELPFELGKRRADRDVLQAEVAQPDAADLHFVFQRGDGIVAVVPDARQRMRGPDRTPVGVADEEHALRHPFFEDLLQLRGSSAAGGEVRVGETRGELVELADPDSRRRWTDRACRS